MAQGVAGLDFDRKNQANKELESINIKVLLKSLETEKRDGKSLITKLLGQKSKVIPLQSAWKKPPKTQVILFQRSMKLLLLSGQCIGLNPVIAISDLDIKKVGFTYFSFRFIYSVLVFISQAIATILCIYRLLHHPISISALAFVSFFASVSITTFLFLRIAMKWPNLLREIADTCLDKHIDSSVQMKCTSYTAVFLATAMVEHILSQTSKVPGLKGCETQNCTTTAYYSFLEVSFPWFKELDIPFNIPLGILLQIVNVTATLNWSFSDVFIVCVSFYLVGILKQINRSIQHADKRIYHPTFWARTREDYTKATRLVSSFDNIISGIILTSFASNLFFICLQLFNVLAARTAVPNMVYFIFSFTFVLGRFLAVSFVGASVHAASLAPAQLLYAVPSNGYCTEVQRFLEQVHGSNVALSGLQFFYVTKGIILSVAGTIITYELVLLQFNNET